MQKKSQNRKTSQESQGKKSQQKLQKPEWCSSTNLIRHSFTKPKKSEYVDSCASLSKVTDSKTKSSQASTSNFHKNSKNSLQNRGSSKGLSTTLNFHEKDLKIAIDDLDD